MALAVRPATVDLFDDVATMLGADGNKTCWCLSWRLTSGEFNRLLTGRARRVICSPVNQLRGCWPTSTGQWRGAITDAEFAGTVQCAAFAEALLPRWEKHEHIGQRGRGQDKRPGG